MMAATPSKHRQDAAGEGEHTGELGNGRAAEHHTHRSKDSNNTDDGKRIRFFEYASVIPMLDLEQLHEDVEKAYGHHGRPQLCSRTYSVPIPTSFTHFFSSPPPREYTYDPSFIPNAPPRLNVKLPSFVRKRRNTISGSGQAHLKSCLKKRKALLGANAATKSAGSTAAAAAAEAAPAAMRGRAYTLASSAPSASCIGNVNPVYCPALAKVVSASQASTAHSPTTSGVNLSSSTSTAMSTTPPEGGAPSHHLPPEPTELLPIRDCCRACRRAAAYGERCSDSEYHENWSKGALAKRKRDEETLFERGEYVMKKKNHGEHVDEAEMNEPGRDIVKDAQVLEKEAKIHHGLHSPLHSPIHSPTHLHDENPQEHRKSPTHTPPLLAHAHARIAACQGARQEKAAAHAQEIDEARERIARLDVGKINRHEDEEEDEESDSDSAKSSPREGDALQMEGIGSPIASPTSPGSGSETPKQASSKRKAQEDEFEKNPICTLEGNMLRPCSSRALYTGGPAVTKAADNDMEADRVSNASSSDLSDDIVSNLSSLGLSPASATTNASSWFGSEDLHSPPEPTLKESTEGSLDYFPTVIQQEKQKGREEQSANNSAPAPVPAERTGCSPLMRSKACLRPVGMYNPSAAEDMMMAQSCPTIKEESQPSTPTASSPSFPSLHRSQTASTALEKEAELREALIEADKPLFTTPARTQSLPANAGRSASPLAAGEGGEARKSKHGWATRFLHRGKGLTSLGVAHGVVH